MLRNTFVHIPGIGATTEKKFWSRGVQSWEELHDAASQLFKAPKAETVRTLLTESQEAFTRRDPWFFYEKMPREYLWRLIPEFSDNIAYLDIETTGMGFPPVCQSTTITFYYRGQVYQEHEHEKKRLLIRKIQEEASLLVTFFGQVFDVPFLQQEFGTELRLAHIDLCFWLKRHGMAGGLKKVQKLFQDIPERLSLDINGYDAVRLWRLHRKGVPGALETLLTYNAEDTVVLEPLLVKAFNLEVDLHSGHGLVKMPMRPMAELTTTSHHEIYEMLRTSGQ